MADPSPQPSLQEARKAFARRHICEAARDLFHRQGYGATTLEHIARAAGTRRTTLYSHFADKAEILEAIGVEYHSALAGLVDSLPGPTPTRAEIENWFDALVTFVVQQRTPAELMIGLGVGQNTPPVVEKVSERFRDALCARLPAFARAFDPGPQNARAHAWAKVILRELSLGCLEAAREEDDGREVLAVVADLMERFVHDRL